jgi:nicotinamidase-related amidase
VNRYTEPEFGASALITIDAQRDTLDGQPLEIPGTSDILPNMRRLLEAFRARRRSIVHVVRLYRRDGSNVDLCRRASVEDGQAILAPGSPGSELAPGLLPADVSLDCDRLLAGGIQPVADQEVIVYKPRWGAFYRTPLERHLRGLGVTTVVFAGCNFPNCPRASIVEASERDFRVALASDAVSRLDERGQAEMRNIGVSVLTTAQLLTNLAGAGSTRLHPTAG